MTEQEMSKMQAMPATEIKEYAQREFCKEFLESKQKQPLAYNYRIIMNMILNNPVWGKWAQINSYQSARKVLDRYAPEWRKKFTAEERADDDLIAATSRIADKVGDKTFMALTFITAMSAVLTKILIL